MLLNVRELCQRHGVGVTGVLHIGAHLAEEAEEYEKLTGGPIVWVEGQPDLIEQAMQALEARAAADHKVKQQHQFVQAWLAGPGVQEVEVWEASNKMSSSIKMPVLHRKYHPNVLFKHPSDKVKASELDTVFWQHLPVDLLEQINLLCMDIQGAEYDVLQGGQLTLAQMDAVYMEVNTKMLYADIALLPKLDRFMTEHGFLRLDTQILAQGWGDAFYVRM